MDLDGPGGVDGELDLDLRVDQASGFDVGPDFGGDERDSFELGGVGDESGARIDLEVSVLERRIEMAGDRDPAPVGVVRRDGELAAIRDGREPGLDPLDSHRLATLLFEGQLAVPGDDLGQRGGVPWRPSRRAFGLGGRDERNPGDRLSLRVEPEDDLGMVDLDPGRHDPTPEQPGDRDVGRDPVRREPVAGVFLGGLAQLHSRDAGRTPAEPPVADDDFPSITSLDLVEDDRRDDPGPDDNEGHDHQPEGQAQPSPLLGGETHRNPPRGPARSGSTGKTVGPGGKTNPMRRLTPSTVPAQTKPTHLISSARTPGLHGRNPLEGIGFVSVGLKRAPHGFTWPQACRRG